ncbi:MAG TPA: heparan-alpha-glucosaminide N-acetyltransferase domain-containing protein [Ferruginibacter sp.]|nr:heparan-alpha-glucosaminide N-acetyltransferase domain-containing protein [Ferruginibacter sp.]
MQQTLANNKYRIASLDLLKGIVMVVMALDHVRDYFHAPAFLYDPNDPTLTSMPIFFTRWITNFCAPVFCFLAGTSAFLVGMRKSKKDLSFFLIKRGAWLVFIEMTIVNFGWYFDIHFHSPGLLVIWSLGISMITLAALIHLPQKAIVVLSLLLIFGHNLLDNVHFPGSYPWAILHEEAMFKYSETFRFYVGYPVIPWIAVMSLGYCFGSLFEKSFNAAKRKKILFITGFSAITLFIILRGINMYGNPTSWIQYDTFRQTLISFLAPAKYPPSLLYLLMTLGPALVFLALTENVKGWLVSFFSTFGRVPFFYYILHLYLIHLLALAAAQLTGFGWQIMILPDWIGYVPALKGYGFPLWVVYTVWVTVILILYPLCRKFDQYKSSHKEKWWLSYL